MRTWRSIPRCNRSGFCKMCSLENISALLGSDLCTRFDRPTENCSLVICAAQVLSIQSRRGVLDRLLQLKLWTNEICSMLIAVHDFSPSVICQGCRRFETSVFFSVKIYISTTGGFRVGFFQPDTNHP